MTQVSRRAVPGDGVALDVLIATLVPIDAAALVVVGGSTWRTALLSAGPAAVASSEFLRRRDPHLFTELGTAAGAILTMCGFAAQFDVPAPILVAVLALVVAAHPTATTGRWYPVVLAGVAGLSPALRVLDDAVFTGMGTLRELGILDTMVPWETAATGTAAAVALVVLGVRRRERVDGVLAFATVAATAIQIWAETDPPPSVGFLTLAITLGLVESGLASPAVTWIERTAADTIADLCALTTGILTLTVTSSAWALLATGGDTREGIGPDHRYTAAVLAVTWLVSWWRRHEERRRGADQVHGVFEFTVPGFTAATLAALYLSTESVLVLGLALCVFGVAGAAFARPTLLVGAGAMTHLGLLAVAATDLWAAAAVAAGAAVAHELAHRSRPIPGLRVLGATTALLAWWFGLGALRVGLVDVYVLPALAGLVLGADRIGLRRAHAFAFAAPVGVAVTVLGRIDDGRPVHSLFLGVGALVVAMWAAVHGERTPLAVAGSIAVSTAAYEALAQSVGVATWGWLVIGGCAATAAGLLEVGSASGRPRRSRRQR
ncbi:MAG: hypothetical protein R2695_08350 [Acidimicrobiales bacterium]